MKSSPMPIGKAQWDADLHREEISDLFGLIEEIRLYVLTFSYQIADFT